MNLVPPCGYQGGKRRYADFIAKKMISFGKPKFYDLGCGSGSVTLALINNGVNSSQITAVDAGPWGMFWREIGEGSFPVDKFVDLLKEVLSVNPKLAKSYIEEKARRAPLSSYAFLVFQAAAYGSSAVWHDGLVWRRGDGNRGYSARGYWEPTETSKEKKPRGTIFAADKMIASVMAIAKKVVGLKGFMSMAEDIDIDKDSTVYIDPPYKCGA